jgi:hypothetical protein
MKTLMKLIVVGIMTFGLVGCVINQETVDAKVGAVQELTKKICQFLPTVQSVTAIFAAASATDPTLATVTAVATAICDIVIKSEKAVETPEGKVLKGQAECPYGEVFGVCVEGKKLN